MTVALRVLTSEELDKIVGVGVGDSSAGDVSWTAGGGWWSGGLFLQPVDYDGDGGFDVLERWTGDPAGDGRFVSSESLYVPTGGYFLSVGISMGPFGGGLTFGNNDAYIYNSLGFGLSPVDVSFGYSQDIAGYLGGLGVSGNGLPGGGLSFDENGHPSAVALQVGTPGASVSYEASISEGWSRFATAFGDWSYDKVGRPYDANFFEADR